MLARFLIRIGGTVFDPGSLARHLQGANSVPTAQNFVTIRDNSRHIDPLVRDIVPVSESPDSKQLTGEKQMSVVTRAFLAELDGQPESAQAQIIRERIPLDAPLSWAWYVTLESILEYATTTGLKTTCICRLKTCEPHPALYRPDARGFCSCGFIDCPTDVGQLTQRDGFGARRKSATVPALDASGNQASAEYDGEVRPDERRLARYRPQDGCVESITGPRENARGKLVFDIVYFARQNSCLACRGKPRDTPRKHDSWTEARPERNYGTAIAQAIVRDNEAWARARVVKAGDK